MTYNPNIHHRRSIRLKGYDYSQAGLYFITICCNHRGNQGRIPFGNIENGEMILNEYGTIAYNEWMKLPKRFINFELDVFQIMPNHMHGIIMLNTVGATLAVAPNDVVVANDAVAPINEFDGARVNRDGARVNRAPTVGDIVGAYKSLVANEWLKICISKNEIMGKLWQRNYHEHIIRDEQSYQRISDYIISNPAKWHGDKFYTT